MCMQDLRVEYITGPCPAHNRIFGLRRLNPNLRDMCRTGCSYMQWCSSDSIDQLLICSINAKATNREATVQEWQLLKRTLLFCACISRMPLLEALDNSPSSNSGGAGFLLPPELLLKAGGSLHP